MADALITIVSSLAKSGAPVLGSLIGSAIGGPAGGKIGATLGGVAGKAIDALAEELGVEPTADAVADAVKEPGAAEAIAAAEARSTEIIRLWQAEVQRAADNDKVEAERGFGAWSLRRTVTTYAVLAMVTSAFGAAMAAALGLVSADTAILGNLVAHGVTMFMAWNGLVSGGRAVTDAARAWRTGK